MKHPLVGPFLGGFYFYVQYQSIWTAGASSREDLLQFTKFYTLLGTNRGQPVDFRKL